jgi:hypothetical protein
MHGNGVNFRDIAVNDIMVCIFTTRPDSARRRRRRRIYYTDAVPQLEQPVYYV